MDQFIASGEPLKQEAMEKLKEENPGIANNMEAIEAEYARVMDI